MLAVFLMSTFVLIPYSNAEPLKVGNQMDFKLIIKVAQENLLLLPNPVSLSVQGEKHERNCRVTQEGNRQFIHCDRLPAEALGSEFSNRSTAAKIEAVHLPRIRNVEELAAFIRNEKDGKHSRYREQPVVHLVKMLKGIEVETSFAMVYDLSTLDLDPREPDSPDIFLVTKKIPTTIWFKDAKHFQFNWGQAILQKSEK